MPVFNFVWTSVYHDSVTLMRLTRDLEAVAGVTRAAAMMGTAPNRALLEDAGLLTATGRGATPTDLVIAVVADDEAAAQAGDRAARAQLTTRAGADASPRSARPRSLGSALTTTPDANLALISVPGVYAAAEAQRALRAGLHVMLFSDNVALDDELALKQLARERGLLLMGPDCGTALIAGVPLGFVNAVPRGRIGIAAAAGTGAQEVMSLIAQAGEGISHVIGVGGRDLSDAVGGLAMEQALAALSADNATSVVCVIGKPPGSAAAKRIDAQIARLGKPCVRHFVGSGSGSLEDCAREAVAQLRGETYRASAFTVPDVDRVAGDARRRLRPEQRLVRGVYAGGTLAWEARFMLEAALGVVAPGVTGGGDGHRVVDLGEDVFTVGRPHPMIDGMVRREWIVREAREPATAVLLLDIVLGHGAHPDPAGELLPAIETATGRGLIVVASVVGTDLDPQHRSTQVARLATAGVIVMPSNAQAARLTARVVAG